MNEGAFMSQFIENLQQHPFTNSVDIFKSSFSDIENLENLSPDELELLNRIKAVVLFSENRFQNTDPFFVPINSMNKIDTLINSINTEISNFKANRNIAHLNNANNFIDNMLIHISNICIPFNTNDLENIRESIISFRKSIGQQLRHTESEYDNLRSNSDNVGKKLEEITQLIEIQKKEINNIIDKYNEEFKDSEIERDEKYKNYFEEVKIKINALCQQSCRFFKLLSFDLISLSFHHLDSEIFLPQLSKF